ncbi:hypothetical protein JG688_00016139, partial [Phytophthora aleatoria]
FDHTIASYPVTSKYLSARASIVNNATFESALVTSKTSQLDVETPLTFVQQALKRSRIAPKDTYIDTTFVPPTSNLIYSDQLRAMKPATLALLVFLKANRSLW